MSGSSSGSSSGATSGSSSDGATALTLNTRTAINAYLEGKTMVMTGSDIPSDPVGASESAGYCWNKVTIQIVSPTDWTVTFVDATKNGSTCDNTVVSGGSTLQGVPMITNVQGNATCFDVDVALGGAVDSGRGSISTDGKTLSLEFYIKGQATGATCADGAVGAHTVTLNGTPFTGNAVQVYRIQ
jgi:hypothetical protein